MIVEIIPSEGIGTAPLRLEAAQVVIRHENGTPLALAAHYGPNNSLAFASVAFNDVEFNRFLRALGIEGTVIVAGTVKTPKPEAGATLLVPPSS